MVGRLPSQCKLCQTLPWRLRRRGLGWVGDDDEVEEREKKDEETEDMLKKEEG